MKANWQSVSSKSFWCCLKAARALPRSPSLLPGGPYAWFHMAAMRDQSASGGQVITTAWLRTMRKRQSPRRQLDHLEHGAQEYYAQAAEKAHVNPQALEQARADLGVVVGRGNTGAHAVQWSLPG